jgi:hypothetical protein
MSVRAEPTLSTSYRQEGNVDDMAGTSCSWHRARRAALPATRSSARRCAAPLARGSRHGSRSARVPLGHLDGRYRSDRAGASFARLGHGLLDRQGAGRELGRAGHSGRIRTLGHTGGGTWSYGPRRAGVARRATWLVSHKCQSRRNREATGGLVGYRPQPNSWIDAKTASLGQISRECSISTGIRPDPLYTLQWPYTNVCSCLRLQMWGRGPVSRGNPRHPSLAAYAGPAPRLSLSTCRLERWHQG